MAEFEVSTIDLSMRSPLDGTQLTANVYTLEGVTNIDGTPKVMSIGQLVMAICLQRAAELEEDLIEKMNKMAVTTEEITALSELDSQLTAVENTDQTLEAALGADAAKTFIEKWTELNGTSGSITTSSTVKSTITAVENLLDSKNTVSQEQLIEIQSVTSKRDQSYDLISACLKSFNTTITGMLANYR